MRSLAAVRIGVTIVVLLAATTACLGTPGPTATPTPSATPSPSVAVTAAPRRICPPTQQLAGAIEGQIGYPVAGTVPLAIYATRVDVPGTYRVLHFLYDQPAGNTTYTMLAVEPGTYVVVAYPVDARGQVGPGAVAGSYTPAVACGLRASCTDHRPIPVTVRSGATTRNVHVLDWPDQPAGLPAPPTGGEPYVVGERVALCNPFADEANVRASAGTAAALVRALANGIELLITDGPRGADGYDWYAVRTESTTGWIVAYALRR